MPTRPPRVRAFRHGGDTFAVISLPGAVAVDAGALTPAEREVADLVVAGLSNAEIARRREVSLRTVANQVAAILAKTGMRSRAELAAATVRAKRR